MIMQRTPTNEILIAMDLGTQKMTVAVAEMSAEGALTLLGVGESASAGMRKAEVTDFGYAQSAARMAMAEAERIHYTIDRLEPLLPGLRDHVEGGASTCWDTEPWARGGGAWFRPGQMGLRPLLALPHGRVHFAGEATSRWPGWVQGAFESARRAAAEVLERS